MLAVFVSNAGEDLFVDGTWFYAPDFCGVIFYGVVGGEGTHAGDVVNAVGGPLIGFCKEEFDILLRIEVGLQIFEHEEAVGGFAILACDEIIVQA